MPSASPNIPTPTHANVPERLPWIAIAAVAAAMAAHGPIVQPDGYHSFADRSTLAGVPHAADVLSNAAFALVGAAGLILLRPGRSNAAFGRGRPGWLLFLVGLCGTAIGSTWYHLAPDNARLVWDRLPIALACAGLLAAIRAETDARANPWRDCAVLGMFAIASVAWWRVGDLAGHGDLRPYLALQGLPLLLIPLWQWRARSDPHDRTAFALALVIYVLAKVAELEDHHILALSGWISGHTIKHLLAAAAALVIVARLAARQE